MRAFVGQRGVVTFGVAEALEGWHVDAIGHRGVIGHRAAVADVGTGVAEETFGPFNPPDALMPRLGLGVVVGGQAVNLLGVEDGVAFEERHFSLMLLAVIASFAARE